MRPASCVWLIVLCLVPQGEPVPSYRLGLILPTTAEADALALVDIHVIRIGVMETYLEAVRDVNYYFRENFTVFGSFHDSSVDPQALTAGVLDLLSSSWPAIALIGPFHLDRIKYIAPIAETSKVPLLSPILARSQMSQFLPRSNTFVLSMQAAKNSFGDELFRLLKHHSWSSIALVITKSTSERVSPYQQNVKNVLSLQKQKQHGVKIEAIAWIPPHQQYANDTAAFEEVVRRQMTKIWASGVTVIALSIEQTTPAFDAVMRAAIRLKLVNKETAWISLNVWWFPGLCWANASSDEVLESVQGMIGTRADITDGADNAPLEVTMLRPYSYRWIKYNPTYQLIYDAVWAIAFAIHKCLSEGIALTSRAIPNGGIQLQRWTSGEQLVNRIAGSDFKGLSGRVLFVEDGTRETWYEILNIVGRDRWRCVEHVGWWGYGQFYFYYAVSWYNNSIRSPIGNLDICRHHLNVLLPGGRYERYMEYSDDTRNRTHFGWAVDLFQHVAKSQCLTNLQFYDEPNMTWDEAIELVGRENDRSSYGDDSSLGFDVAIGPFPVTTHRSINAEFTRTIKTVAYRVAVLRPQAATSKLWQFLKPFSWQLWLVTAAFFVVSGLVLFALEKKRKAFPDNSPRLIDSVFVSMSALFYTQDQDSVISKSGRGFIVVVCFVVLILCACFTANLSVFLLKSQETSTFKSLEDITRDGVIGAPNVTGALKYLQETYPTLTFKDVAPGQGLEQLTSNQVAAYVDDSSLLEFQARTNCKIQLLEGKLHTVNAAFAMKRHSPYKEKINQGILEAWAANYIEDLDQKYFEWADECRNYGQVADDEPLELQHLGGLFIIFSVSAAACLLGDLLLRFLYKNQCIKRNLDDEPAGVHATARGIKATVETTADIGLSASRASSTWNLTETGLIASEQIPERTKRQDLVTSVFVSNALDGEIANGTGRRGPLPPIEL